MLTLRLVLAAALIAVVFSSDVHAQQPRDFAPGVLQVIEPEIHGRDVHSLQMALPGLELGEYQPANFVHRPDTLHGLTEKIVIRRDVWQHEFAFLPLRQLNVTATNLSGKVRQRNIWYMPYRIRNVGAYVGHKVEEDVKFEHVDYVPELNPETTSPDTLSNRCFANLTLSGWVEDPVSKTYSEVFYSDVVAPSITKIIQNTEDPNRPLIDKIQLAQMILDKVPAESDEGGVWAVAIWYNVDPSMDFVSVKVHGLTNAYRMEVNADKSIEFKNKTLQLNFYRPGDGINQADDPIDYGIPLTDSALAQVEIARRYNLPGPVIIGEAIDPDTLRAALIFETDADINTDNFESRVAEQLDAGQIPENVSNAFSNAGISLGGDAAIVAAIPRHQWTVTDTWEGNQRQFTVRLKPEFWEKGAERGIRLIKRLEYLWVYE